MPYDPELGSYQANIDLERLSGTRESWLRLNKGFASQIRRQFLHWRAVTPPEREELLAEIRETIGNGLAGSGEP